MNKQEKIRQFARMLDEADRTKKPIDKIKDMAPDFTVEDAYAVQQAAIELRLQRGDKISGKKIGLTSLAMQKLLGIGECDYGQLFESMEAHGGICDTRQLLFPMVEGEVFFVLKHGLKGPGVTAEDVRAATAYVVAGIEVVDTRFKDYKFTIVDTVSDNAACGMYVIGGNKVELQDIDLSQIHMKMYRNGELVNEGMGSDVMGDPVNAVAWLANKLGAFGVSLNAGDVVLSGALTAMAKAEKGDVFEVEFTKLGKVTAKFI
jgi:2-keto-4-pentenoate hydratase